MARGRFSDVQGNEDPIKLTDYLSDIVVAKVVNEEWRYVETILRLHPVFLDVLEREKEILVPC
jgi:hypothetical protein